MATPFLPSTSSIVEYLKTSGQDSSFGSRRKLYSSSGLDKRLGEYTGSANQNLTLLKNLQTQNTPKTTTPTPVAPSTATPGVVTPALNTVNTLGKTQTSTPQLNRTEPGKMNVQDIINRATGIKTEPNQSILPIPEAAPEVKASDVITPPTQQAPAQPVKPEVDTNYQMRSGETPETYNQRIAQYRTPNASGVTAESVVPDGTSDEADLVADWLASPEGQLFAERQQLEGMDAEAANEEAKAELEAKYASEKATLEQELADKGLAFSGVRASQVKALSDSLASSLIGVDRKFASKLLDANLDLREAILKGVADLAKEAQEGRKEAIQQLNAIGYAVINGELVPTLAARSAERADRQLELSEARLALSEQAALRAEARFEQLYGQEQINGYQAVEELLAANPTATEADVRAAIRSNPDIFGKMSEGAIDDAVNLIGMPETLRETFAKSYVDTFDGVFTDRATAKEEAKKAVMASGGKVSVKQGDTTKVYTLTTDQLEDMKALIDLQ